MGQAGTPYLGLLVTGLSSLLVKRVSIGMFL